MRFQSTHPVRGGTYSGVEASRPALFQSTHPVRGGTAAVDAAVGKTPISIHPPREGWDHVFRVPAAESIGFQSTHPVRGGTVIPHGRNTLDANFNPPTP